MILIDLNQIVIANIMQEFNIKKSDELDLGFLRHLILNSIRSIKTKFSADYGELVLCDDTSDYWRKHIFPFYKENRKKIRAKSDYNWNNIFKTLKVIKEEIAETFPYKYIAINHCEADDIIAVLSKTFYKKENILIVSNDKDFVQLYKYPNVYQYSPLVRKFLQEGDPVNFLLTKIIKGDVSDGIPNILSDDDTFVCENKRQRKITKNILENFDLNKLGHSSYENWLRNKKLIDFDEIPKNLEHKIIEVYHEPILGNHEKAFSYLTEHSLKLLLLMYGEF